MVMKVKRRFAQATTDINLAAQQTQSFQCIMLSLIEVDKQLWTLDFCFSIKQSFVAWIPKKLLKEKIPFYLNRFPLFQK